MWGNGVKNIFCCKIIFNSLSFHLRPFVPRLLGLSSTSLSNQAAIFVMLLKTIPALYEIDSFWYGDKMSVNGLKYHWAENMTQDFKKWNESFVFPRQSSQSSHREKHCSILALSCISNWSWRGGGRKGRGGVKLTFLS